MGRVNPTASQTLQHGVWAASRYFNSVQVHVKLECLTKLSARMKMMFGLEAATMDSNIVKISKDFNILVGPFNDATTAAIKATSKLNIFHNL